jgi:hypothetical protein
MRRADLEVGQRLAHKRSKHYPTVEVEVLDVRPHVYSFNYRELRPVSKGTGVLVKTQGHRRNIIVPLAQLVGPWDQVSSAEQIDREEEQRVRQVEARALEEAHNRYAVARAKAGALGVQVYPSGVLYASVNVPVAALAAMIDKLTEIGWKMP